MFVDKQKGGEQVMSILEDMIDERINSSKWDSDIARRVMNKKALFIRRTRFLFSIAASIVAITGMGIYHHMNQRAVLKSTFDYIISETVAGSNENTVISKDMDTKIIQYCMNTK